MINGIQEDRRRKIEEPAESLNRITSIIEKLNGLVWYIKFGLARIFNVHFYINRNLGRGEIWKNQDELTLILLDTVYKIGNTTYIEHT